MFKPKFQTPATSSSPLENSGASEDVGSKIVEKKEIATNDVSPSPSVQSDVSPGCLPSMMERHDENHSLRPSQDSSTETKETEEHLSKGQEETEAKGKAAKSKKKEKDPNAPKRSKSSFMFYCSEARGGLREEQPKLSITEVSKELGRRWQALTPAEKAKYEEMAEEDRGRYQGEKKRFEESRPQPPKRAKSSYIFFSNDTRAQVALDSPNMKLPDIAKELGRRWSSLETAEKAKYEEMAAEDKKRYVKEKEKYELRTGVEDLLDNILLNITKNSLMSPAIPTQKSETGKKKKVAKRSQTEVKVTDSPVVTKKKKATKRARTEDSPVVSSKKKKVDTPGTKETLLRLQKTRDGGTWAQCSLKTCSEWRYLPEVKDPAVVPELFTCSDCEAEEEQWDYDLDLDFVETKFTVGSLVWAKMKGFPAWPAMVDDDPDLGVYFWTEEEAQQPSSYHVIFFDEKAVSRAWLASSRLTKFDLRPEMGKTGLGSRLETAFNTAVKAAGETLEGRREKYCFAQRYQGTWGPNWSHCEEEVDSPPQEGEHFTTEEKKDLIEEKNSSVEKKDLAEKKIVTSENSTGKGRGEVVDIPQSHTDHKQKSPARTPLGREEIKMLKKGKAGDVTGSKTVRLGKENQPPSKVLAHLNLSKVSIDKDPSQYEEDSLAKEVRQAVEKSNLFTPTKRENSYMQVEKEEEASADIGSHFDVNSIGI